MRVPRPINVLTLSVSTNQQHRAANQSYLSLVQIKSEGNLTPQQIEMNQNGLFQPRLHILSMGPFVGGPNSWTATDGKLLVPHGAKIGLLGEVRCEVCFALD